VHGIFKTLTNYALTEPLLGKKIKKSTKVLTIKKVTDHAIIPTEFRATYNTINSRCMISSQTFYCRFYDDCSVANTTVIGKADVCFQNYWKSNSKKGWRVVLKMTPKKRS
jgi:DNA topoisomerase-3